MQPNRKDALSPILSFAPFPRALESSSVYLQHSAKSTIKHVATLTLLSLLTLVPACGSSAKVDSRATTVGQELKDLDEARNCGLLTEDEYNRKRSEIMSRDEASPSSPPSQSTPMPRPTQILLVLPLFCLSALLPGCGSPPPAARVRI